MDGDGMCGGYSRGPLCPHRKWYHSMPKEERDGAKQEKGGGREVQDRRNICIPMAGSC